MVRTMHILVISLFIASQWDAGHVVEAARLGIREDRDVAKVCGDGQARSGGGCTACRANGESCGSTKNLWERKLGRCCPGQKCRKGVCLASCEVNGNCGGGEICLNGVCTACPPKCQNQGRCCDGIICFGGSCVEQESAEEGGRIHISGGSTKSSVLSIQLMLVFVGFLVANFVGLVFCYSYTYYKRRRLVADL